VNAQNERRARIAEFVVRQGEAAVEDLVRLTGVSPMTVYRDLAALEEAGLVLRHHGHVTAAATQLSEASAGFRIDQAAEAKRAIAQYAAGLVQPGASVMFDDSTSGLWVLRALIDTVPLTVVTNSLLVAREARQQPAFQLFVTGGHYHEWAEALLGRTTIESIAALHTEFAFMSASGLSNGACFHPYEEVAAVKQAMIRAAERPVLLLDHTKFQRQAVHAFAQLTDFSLVIVDAATPAATVEQLRSDGVNVEVADHL
jgi:DeoR/GlpR family transcriptional regulator of sugar metabolism